MLLTFPLYNILIGLVMHSTHGSSRRHSRYDEDELIVTRLDDVRSESYSRTHHHHSSRTEAYSSSQRGYSDSSSRNRSQLDWDPPDSVYSTSRDIYREENAMPNRRDYYNNADSWSGRHTNNHHSSSSSREWSKRDDRSYTYPSEGNSWRGSRYENGRSRNGVDDWGRNNVRVERDKKYDRDIEHVADDVNHRTRDDSQFIESERERRPMVWPERSDQRQWRASSRNFEPERQRDREQDWKNDQGRSTQNADDRQWEPAASWKSREGDDTTSFRRDRGQSVSLPPKNNKKNSKNKKGPSVIKREGFSRREDTMNNWKKRDYRPVNREEEHASVSKRKFAYSPESRSRSPSLSVYSRRSSARSRSRSPTPKIRGRVEGSPRRDISKRRNERDHRSPPLPSYEGIPRGRQRRESLSSRSSQSRSRSRSSSEGVETKPKPKHRLPTSTSLLDIEIQAKSMRLTVNQKVNNNGHSPKRARTSEEKQNKIQVQDNSVDRRDEHDTMPPPVAPLSSKSSAISQGSGSVTLDTHKGTKRNAGFKPIGLVQSSASIKRFFPDEDEESDFDDVHFGSNQKSVPQFSQTSKDKSPRKTGLEAAKQSKWDVEPSEPRTTRNSASIRSNGNQASLKDVTHKPTTEAIPNGRGNSTNGSDNPSSHEPVEHSTDVASNRTSGPSQITQHDNGVSTRQESVTSPYGQVYSIISQVGEGTFGKVYKAQNNVSGANVALKRIRMETERDGFPVTAMREIKLLQSLRHVNVIELVEMMVLNGSVYMVFEYMDHDLTGVLSQTQFTFTDAHLKSLCQQMLCGLSYLHRKGVVHRDIKGANILLNNRGELKLADFGLARFYQKRRRADYTNRVITLWYRPPELLLGTTVYGPEVDMWSAGCIMLELYCKKPVFQGNDEIHQLDVIYKILGTPTTKDWPSLSDMPWYELIKPKPKDAFRNRFRDIFQRWLSPAALDLAERLLTYDPARRVTADQALEAPYFTQELPSPVLPTGLSTLEGEWHEFETKRERARKRRKLEGAPTGSTGQLAQ